MTRPSTPPTTSLIQVRADSGTRAPTAGASAQIRVIGSLPGRHCRLSAWRSVASSAGIEVDDDLAVHVPAGLKLNRGADLLDREARRDGHAELARRDQASNLLDGAGGGVSAVCRRDPVDLCSDGGDALVRNANFSCRLRRLRPV